MKRIDMRREQWLTNHCVHRRAMVSPASLLLLAATLLAHSFATPPPVDVLPTDPRLLFNGRWFHDTAAAVPSATTDWPCASLRFGVAFRAQRNASQPTPVVEIVWSNLRDRVNATVRCEATGRIVHSALFEGPAVFSKLTTWPLTFPAVVASGNYTIELRKLTTAAPFGMGIGSRVLSPSTIDFRGLRVTGGARRP